MRVPTVWCCVVWAEHHTAPPTRVTTPDMAETQKVRKRKKKKKVPDRHGDDWD